MDIKDILESLTPEDIISIMESLGAELSNRSNSKELIFTSICHDSNSYKLYYSIEFRTFYCWSSCGKLKSLLDLLIHINGYEIIDGINEIKRFFNIGNDNVLRRGFRVKKKYIKPSLDDIEIEVLPIPQKPYIYTLNKQIRIPEWEKDFINYDALQKFEIRYDDYNNSIVIPHFDIDNRVVGIRTRNLDEELIERYGKYCPYYKDGQMYNHQLGKNVFGLNVVKDNIKKYKKVQVFESEKGSLQSYSMFEENSIAVSICGSSCSMIQKKMLIDLKINEWIWCVDKQYSN